MSSKLKFNRDGASVRSSSSLFYPTEPYTSVSEKDEINAGKLATYQQVLSFIFHSRSSTWLFVVGSIAGILHGLVYPGLAFLVSNIFSDLQGSAESGLGPVRTMAFAFMGLGAYSMISHIIKTWCFEIVSFKATRDLRLRWFQALLRQDAAYFDVYDISGTAASVQATSNRFRNGINKFPEGVQSISTAIGGFVFALYSSWKTALVVLGIIPIMAGSTLMVMHFNQTKSARAQAAYARAGGVAYTSISSIRTVLSLNAVSAVIAQYNEATKEAFQMTVSTLWKHGLANGSMAGTFTIMQCILALYGASLIYNEVSSTGCDPSGSVAGNSTCTDSGSGIFGAMLGITFASRGFARLGNFYSALVATRAATYPAIQAISRSTETEEKRIYSSEDSSDEVTDSSSQDVEQAQKIKAILPKYAIDSSSTSGLKPQNVKGSISFRNVGFSYPTRANDLALCKLTLDIEAGKTIALVGPSGGGKSTTISLLERFYDPSAGQILLDGVDLRKINVSYLRSSLIGYVAQEPKLFSTTIAENIRYGNPNATQEEIEKAATMANAHEFIMSFPEGYQTLVGDNTQLSGGQAQRICIARALTKKPAILILDEATSALDSQSERVVQAALDKAVKEYNRTTIVIAHRLNTIRNCDLIAVIANGAVVEKGTHEELMAKNGHYRKLVEKQENKDDSSDSDSASTEADETHEIEENEEMGAEGEDIFDTVDLEPIDDQTATPHFSFKNCSFSYPTRPDRKILDSFNLAVRQGETLALVGPSGGGKSTVVALLERFYQPSEGYLEYMGQDVSSLNIQSYRDQIGYVGQQPTLFNETIAKNVAYGHPEATQEEIEEACKQANCHDFIQALPQGYQTLVGDGGGQLSGGQKQRVAIARALVKKPKVLILDEATSALDTESEAIVQEALDNYLIKKGNDRTRTAIVIAHRLTTIRNADRIAYIANGKVQEIGSHHELMAKPHGRYRQLVQGQLLSASKTASLLSTSSLSSLMKQSRMNSQTHDNHQDQEEKVDHTDKKDPIPKDDQQQDDREAFSAARARQMAAPDTKYLVIGAVGAVISGAILPVWGTLLGQTLQVLYTPVSSCHNDNTTTTTVTAVNVTGDDTFDYCQNVVWAAASQELQDKSFWLGLYWFLTALVAVVGVYLLSWGFGMASERLNKRVRDDIFGALMRQEVAFFDQQPIGFLLTQLLQEDATRIYTFVGEPIQGALVALSAVTIGIGISFFFMWPFALLTLGCIPIMAKLSSLHISNATGGDEETDDNDAHTINAKTPGGVLVETLLHMRTVSALALEAQRFQDYQQALETTESDRTASRGGFWKGLSGGIAELAEQWIRGLQFWWGSYLLFHYADTFSFQDYLVSNFSLLTALIGLGSAVSGIVGGNEREQVKQSAGRIFALMDRTSDLDPLANHGKKID